MKHKILVVEDDPPLLDTVEYNLERQQYTVHTATDGAAALQVARQEQPDLIVLDLMLPGLDGLEVCRILRQEHLRERGLGGADQWLSGGYGWLGGAVTAPGGAVG